jgi:hypothetical protein
VVKNISDHPVCSGFGGCAASLMSQPPLLWRRGLRARIHRNAEKPGSGDPGFLKEAGERSLFNSEYDVIAESGEVIELLVGAGLNGSVGTGRKDDHSDLCQAAGSASFQ